MDAATRRALQTVGTNAEDGITALGSAGTERSVLPGMYERLGYVDATGHGEGLERYRARGER